jgi:polysaccharide pyruvyl transferase WcaK-like protein
MKILLTECYSATNIGDLELVSRSLQLASEIYTNGEIECVASDPNSFVNIITTTSFSRPIFDRLKMIRGVFGG